MNNFQACNRIDSPSRKEKVIFLRKEQIVDAMVL